MDNKAAAFSWLRAMSGGALTLEQVQAGDKVIDTLGLAVFAALIGYTVPTGVTGQWDISAAGYQIIREFEGLRLKSYQDSKGIWTIGYGTIKYPDGTRVRAGDTCTQAQAEQYLKNDCAWVDAALDRLIHVKVTQKQFDALASFVYNVGETAFSTSTLLSYLNEGRIKEVSTQFLLWNKITKNGVKVVEKGLDNRRHKERALFLS